VVINPGNPTGAIFNEGTIKQIIKFATKNKLLIIADEVIKAIYKGLSIEYLQGRSKILFF
jgi:aspartate/methionine/tyrosine aminotransferase